MEGEGQQSNPNIPSAPRSQLIYPLDPQSEGALKEFLEKNFPAYLARSRKDALTILSGATSFNVTSNFMVITGAVSVTIATIKGGYEGQIIVLQFTDANVIITDTSGGAMDTINLQSSFTSSADAILTLQYDGTSWREVSRNVSSSTNKQSFTAGAAITAGQPLHLSPYAQIDGGIKLDTHGSNGFNDTTNQILSVTVGNNSNRLLLIGVLAASTPSSVTYNSVAMTLVDSQALGLGFSMFLYKLVAPSTGVNNVSVTATLIANISYASFYNVNQTTYVEATAKGATSASLATISQGAFVYAIGGETNSSAVNPVSSFPITAVSKYVDTVNLTSTFSKETGNNTALASAYGAIINEVITETITPLPSGGAGTVVTGVIAVSIAPATAVSLGVVPTNSSAIVFNEPLIDFIGFADSTVSAGATISVTVSGVITGLSGLTAGKVYYLKDVVGTIGTTKGTYGKVIGVALSATTLLLAPNKTVGTAITKVAGYTYTAECDGLLTGQTSGASATVTIVGESTVSPQVGSTANYSTPGTTAIGRGATYSFTVSGASQNLRFTPLA
jgi:hypothetical protein